MKTTKRLLSCLLVLAMLFALAIPAFAADDTFTITVANAAEGATYKLYKVFNAVPGTGDAISYQLAEGVSAPAEGSDFYKYFKIDSTDNVQVLDAAKEKGKDNVLTQAAANALLAIAGNPVATSNTPDANGEIVFPGLTAGYYIVQKDDKAASWLSVNTATGNQTIYDKNASEPTPDLEDSLKKVTTEGVGQSADGTQVTAKVGDTLNFQVKFNATRFVTEDGKEPEKVTQYVITDTAKGLSALSNIVVTIGGDSKTENIDYTVTSADGTTTITIPWVDNDGNFKYANNVDVIITYSATVTATTASNEAKVNYNGKTESVIPGDKVEVKTYSFTLKKVDGDNTNTILTGAEFKLYEESQVENMELKANAEPVKFSVSQDGKTYTVAPNGTVDTITAGEVTIKGLKGGTKKFNEKGEQVGETAATVYYLKETKAPAGYNAVDELKKVSMNGTDASFSLTSTIENNKGTVLPSTGGIGTTMFYVIGGLMVAAAVVVLVSKKRMGAEQ